MTRKFPFWVPGKKNVAVNRKEEVRRRIELGREGKTRVWFCTWGVGSIQQEAGK